MLLRDLAVDPRDEDELRWRFLWGDGEMTEPSSFPAMTARLEAGGRTGGKPIVDIDPRRLAAAGRCRRIDGTLALLSDEQRRVLFAAFAPFCHGGPFARLAVVPGRPLRLFGQHPGAAFVTDAAWRAHAASGTSRELDEWLAKLCQRIAQRPTPADRLLGSEIRREAEALVLAAMRAYSAARRTRR